MRVVRAGDPTAAAERVTAYLDSWEQLSDTGAAREVIASVALADGTKLLLAGDLRALLAVMAVDESATSEMTHESPDEIAKLTGELADVRARAAFQYGQLKCLRLSVGMGEREIARLTAQAATSQERENELLGLIVDREHETDQLRRDLNAATASATKRGKLIVNLRRQVQDRHSASELDQLSTDAWARGFEACLSAVVTDDVAAD